jgi:putative molybdopterin biosynthesis protein
MSVTLSYRFSPNRLPALPSCELQLQNQLFILLSAIREHGSIGRAAKSLDVSYRHLWGEIKEQEALLGASLLTCEHGQAARLSEFGERLLWAEKRTLARLLPDAEALAAKIDHDLLLAARPTLRSLAVSASHDLLFSTLRDCVRTHAEILLDVDFVGSAAALECLNQGSCVLAGMHLPLNDEHLCRRGSHVHQEIGRHLRLGDHKLIRMASRDQGLMVRRGNPLGIAGISDLTRPEIRIVNRQTGSGTRILFDELLRHHQIAPDAIRGYDSEEPTHLSVAASVAAGLAECGIGLRAAAVRFDLDFVPLVTEQYFIVCRKALLKAEPVCAVIEVLGSTEFKYLAEALPGYSAIGAGEVISLRGVLPWYK